MKGITLVSMTPTIRSVVSAIDLARITIVVAVALACTGVAAQDCPATVTDVDGNEYPVVRIGDQCWMAENLRTGHYRNGWPIMSDLSVHEWNFAQIGAYLDIDRWGEGYGKVYNWFAVSDLRGICPEGWSVASNEDWNILIDGLGGEEVAADALRSQEGWRSPDAGATNASGFSAKPAGYRSYFFDGSYGNDGMGAYFWTSTPSGLQTSWSRVLYRLPQVHTYSDDVYYSFIRHALSCRCIMDPVTGIDDRTGQPTMRIFPNPAQQRFFIEWEHALPAEMHLFDAVGRNVLSRSITDPISQTDIAALPAGLYIVRVTGGGRTYATQLVKED